jgi:hypothetical protein
MYQHRLKVCIDQSQVCTGQSPRSDVIADLIVQPGSGVILDVDLLGDLNELNKLVCVDITANSGIPHQILSLDP